MKPGCFICGNPGEFQVKPGDSLREAWCPVCGAKKRSSDLAAVIVRNYGGGQASSLAGMTDTLAPLCIYEAQAIGPLHDFLSKLPFYTCSEYLDDIPEGGIAHDGVRCENLERLSFTDNSFDLVITQDVMEHVSRPEQAFREIHRVLKPGGRHIFTVPVHEGRQTTQRIRADGERQAGHSFPVYHGDPLRKESGSLVHTDFGDDLVSYLAALTIPSEIVFAERFYAQEEIPWLADDQSRAQYLSAVARGDISGFFRYNSIIIITWKPTMTPEKEETADFSGERYLPTLDWPEVAFEHWHRYLHATELVSGKSVLDIACGEGYGSFTLAGRAGSVVGVDISRDAIQRATSRYFRDNLTFLTGSCVKVPIEGRAVFDIIVSFETLEHLSSLEQKMFLAEMKRLLKPGGLFIVSTPNKLLYSDLPGHCNDYHIKEFYVGEFRDMLRNFFSDVKLLGQKVYPVSYIWDANDNSRTFREYGLEFHDGQFRPGDGTKKLLYAIALCSDGAIAESGASILIDLSERMLKFIKELEANGGRLAEMLRKSESDRAARSEQIEVMTRELATLRHTSDVRVKALEEQVSQQAAENSRLSAIEKSLTWRMMRKVMNIIDRLWLRSG